MIKKNADLVKLQERIVRFRDKRDWKQFHNPKDMAISLSLEAAELLEHFQWRSKREIEKYIKKAKKNIGEELSDVLYWILLLSHDLRIDLVQALDRKMQENEKKYPISKSRGKHKKYKEL